MNLEMSVELEGKEKIRICRIGTYPTINSPGTGLPCYYLARGIKAPTLFLTRRVNGFVDVPEHVQFVAVDYRSPAFDERISIGKVVKKLAGIVEFFLKSIPHIVKFRPNIIHIHSPLYLIHALFVKHALGGKVCMTFHGTDVVRIRNSPVLKRLIKFIGDEFFYVSRSMEEVLRPFLPPEKLHYTPNGVDLGIFKNKEMKKEKLIAAVGSLRWQKGYEHLVEAFSMLEEREYRLVIAGDGPLKGKLEEMIEGMQLKERVTLAGMMDHNRLVDLLNRSAVYVMSSVTEGFPKALVEAMACGTAVVVTDVGSCREIVGDAGIVVKPRSASDLHNALETLIRNKGLRERLSRLAPIRARRFDWSSSVSTVQRVYLELIGVEPASPVKTVHRTARDAGGRRAPEKRNRLYARQPDQGLRPPGIQETRKIRLHSDR